MNPIRVLYLNGGALDYGGITTVMLNYAARMDPDKVRIDFLVHGEPTGPREQEAVDMGAKVFHAPCKRTHYWENRRALLSAMKGYDIVHAHMDGMNGYVLKLAKQCGVPYRISHCHNTRFLTNQPLRIWLHRRAADSIDSVATALYACSPEAGRFLYGDAPWEEGRVTIIRNAVALDRYAFSEGDRLRLRREMGLEDRFVIGNVGRYEYQKNQGFLIDAFKETVAIRPDAVLLLAGDGSDRPMLEEKIRVLGLTESVRLLGYRKDIDALLSAMDLFVLPSRFEGLGIVLIEAQACGLSCLASDQVPPDTRVTQCRYLSLSDPVAWGRQMAQEQRKEARAVSLAPFIAAGYDIERESEKLQNRYLEMIDK